MNTVSGKAMGFLKSLLLFSFFAIILFSLPLISYAQTGTLGTEKPEIYCTYYQDGVQVDGNSLSAGTYEVRFMASGVKNVSVIELTADYSEAAQVAETPVSLMSDELMGMRSMGCVIGGGKMVFGFVSTNDDTTPCTDKEFLIASVQVTFSADCDAADVITAQTHPNLTFIQADYNDGYEDCYSLDPIASDYKGDIYPMSCDITPDLSQPRTVSGTIVTAIDYTGKTAGKAAYGNYTFTVYSDAERTSVVDTFTSAYDAAAKVNTFSLLLADGTYYASLSYDYALTREDITITVNGADITNQVIPVIACNFFNSDTSITINDTRACQSATLNSEGKEYCDLNADGSVTVNDTRIVQACALGTASLAPIEIK